MIVANRTCRSRSRVLSATAETTENPGGSLPEIDYQATETQDAFPGWT